MFLLFFYLFLALSISFTCSILESVLLSTPLPFLMARSKEGDKKAQRLIKMKEKIDRPLSAILSLNTIAHTVGAAGVGSQATIVFGEEYFGWASAILTILILVFTEIIPKTIGTRYAKSLAGVSGAIIQAMIIIVYPIVIASAYITNFFSKKRQGNNTTSREEISVLANIGTEEGILMDNENKIIQNLIHLKQIRVSEIMTPRVVLACVDEETNLAQFLKNKRFLSFSRVPVYANNPENITGFVLRQTVFERVTSGQKDLKLVDIKRSILFVPKNETVLSVWENLMKKKEHIALVVDEYGGVDGIVTLEDIIETLLGIEILDEKDTISDMQQFARDRWENRRSKFDIVE